MDQWSRRGWSKWAGTFFKVRLLCYSCVVAAEGVPQPLPRLQLLLGLTFCLTLQRDKPLGSEPWFNPEAVTEQKVSRPGLHDVPARLSKAVMHLAAERQ